MRCLRLLLVAFLPAPAGDVDREVRPVEAAAAEVDPLQLIAQAGGEDVEIVEEERAAGDSDVVAINIGVTGDTAVGRDEDGGGRNGIRAARWKAEGFS